jgi:Protein of unknown function (DUF4232)
MSVAVRRCFGPRTRGRPGRIVVGGSVRNTGFMPRPNIHNRPSVVRSVVVIALASLVAFGCDAAASASSAKVRAPVLGQKGFGVPSATGWGTYEPREFFNGGDPSGHVGAITWRRWGSRAATGAGRGVIFMPNGGYYPGTVKVDLRAFDLGHCTSHGPLAYQRLDVRYPSRPGGKLGTWRPWGGSGSLCVKTSRGTTTTTPTAGAFRPCRDGQISVSDAGGGAGVGHEDQVILFTNSSQSPCTLSGYPGVAGLDAQDTQVVQAERTLSGYLGGLENGAATPPIVSLLPGKAASATVEGTDVPVGSATSCPSYPALLVTPPNLTLSVRVTPGLPGCSPLQIHPVVPGSSGSAD